VKNNRRLITSIVFVGLVVLGAIAGFLTGTKPLLGLDLEGGLSVTLEGPTGVSKDVMEKALERIRSRVDALGVAEPDISLVGSNLIQVQLPGLGGQGSVKQQGTWFCSTKADKTYLGCFDTKAAASAQAGDKGTVDEVPLYVAYSSHGQVIGKFRDRTKADARAKEQSVARVLQIIGTTARLEEREVLSTIAPSDPAYATSPLTPTDPSTGAFQTTTDQDPVVSYQDTDGNGVFTDGVDTKYNLGGVEITGADLSKATAVFSTSTSSSVGQGWIVTFSLNKAGSKKFGDATTRLVGKQLAIVLDGAVESAPTVNQPITGGTGEITGGFSEQAAKNLAVVLNSGSLPVELAQQEVRTVSPLLGKSSLHQGLIAGVVGLVGLMIYLAFYYRLLGLVTWVGMAIWGVLAIGLVAFMGSSIGYALTLAGVAGIIVSLGITADSYIVFYERLKDEVRHGKSLRSAVVPAFQRSWRTIVAADTVTIIAAAVLYVLAVGSVRGFALTLGLSTALDMFVVYFFKRPTVYLISKSPRLTSLRGMGLRSGVAADPVPVAGGDR
jgi:preprotein translocase subunit SecD